jgi:hypothetical protein
LINKIYEEKFSTEREYELSVEKMAENSALNLLAPQRWIYRQHRNPQGNEYARFMKPVLSVLNCMSLFGYIKINTNFNEAENPISDLALFVSKQQAKYFTAVW